MKLQQGQIWNRGGEYLRIVDLQRLEVEYKSLLDPASRDGTHHRLSKKEFCRLLKGAALLPVMAVAHAQPAAKRTETAAAPQPARTRSKS